MNGLKVLDLQNVGGGAAVELFNREFSKVLSNIEDVNTAAKETREVVLRIKVTPDEGRAAAVITVKCSSKLAGVKPQQSAVFLGRDKGKAIALLNDPKQVEMAFQKPAPLGMVGAQTPGMAPGEVPLDA